MKPKIVVFLLLCLAGALWANETNLTVDSVVYSNVVFKTATPATVTIFHSTGVATIPLYKLPPDLQKQFGYDPAKAEAYDKAYATAKAKYDEEKATANANAELLQKAEEIDGAVFDIEKEGFLMSRFTNEWGMTRCGGQWLHNQLPNVFVVGAKQDGLIDGTPVKLKCIPDGTYTYVGTDAGSHTVSRYKCLERIQ
jgi:hypothetical protein